MLADVDVGHCFIGPYKEPFIHSTARQDMFMLFWKKETLFSMNLRTV